MGIQDMYEGLQTYNIEPFAKPRMTRSDKWRKRACVLEYYAFKDKLRVLGADVRIGDHISFHISMPATWSKKKKTSMAGQPHQSKPDLDNLIKSVFDSILDEDKHIWKISAEKRWAYAGKIEIRAAEQVRAQ